MTKVRFIAIALATLTLVSCGKFKPHPVTWEDIAQTIPANPEYVVSVNTAFEADSALNDIWAKEDILHLLHTGMALDSVRPSHFVVVAMPKATFITWPLPNPQEIAKKAADWPIASLNNTVDARILVRGKASLVLSSTQAWVVNNVHGQKFVNELLSAAMNTKAGHTVPFYNCITSVPKAVRGVVPYEGKYYTIDLNHEDGLLRVDVDAYGKFDKKLDIVDGLGRLPIEYIDEASPVLPFAAIQVDRGTMPDLLVRLAKLSGKKKLKLGAGVVAKAFDNVAGTVVARWTSDAIEVELPYDSDEAARISAKQLHDLLKLAGYHMDIKVKDNKVTLAKNIDNILPPEDRDSKTPRRHTETENPSAIAFARLDIDRGDPVDAYFELAPTHARLQIDFKENASNLAEAVELIKTIVFRVL